MTTGATAVPAGHRTVAQQGLLWGLLTGVAAGAAAAAGVAPFATLATVLFVACGIGVLHSPLVFLWIITAISGIGLGWTDTAAIELAGRTINISGLRWALVIATSVVVLLRYRGAAVPRALRGLLPFLLATALGILWAADRFEGVKQFLLYAAPLLIALVVMRTVRQRADIMALRSALYVAAGLGTVMGLVPALAGDVLGGPFDPEGRLLHRSFGMFLVPVMALAMARFRYGDAKHGLLALAVFVLALPTQARNALGAMLAMPLFMMLGTSWRLRVALAGLLLVAGMTAYTYEPLRERIFADPQRGFTLKVEIRGSGQDAQLEIAGLQLTGRGLVWLQTMTNAVRAPWLGHGTGSSTTFLAHRTGGYILLPHNEYLRIFHDLGAFGLVLLLGGFASVLVALSRVHRAATSLMTRELALAALLCWLAFVLIAVVDNPLGYFFFFTSNVFLLSALALRSAELDGTP
jgi:O-antigen ligase